MEKYYYRSCYKIFPCFLDFPHISLEMVYRSGPVVKSGHPQTQTKIRRLHRNIFTMYKFTDKVILAVCVLLYLVVLIYLTAFYSQFKDPYMQRNMHFLGSGNTCGCLSGLVQKDNSNHFVFPLTQCCAPESLQRRSLAS